MSESEYRPDAHVGAPCLLAALAFDSAYGVYCPCPGVAVVCFGRCPQVVRRAVGHEEILLPVRYFVHPCVELVCKILVAVAFPEIVVSGIVRLVHVSETGQVAEHVIHLARRRDEPAGSIGRSLVLAAFFVPCRNRSECLVVAGVGVRDDAFDCYLLLKLFDDGLQVVYFALYLVPEMLKLLILNGKM